MQTMKLYETEIIRLEHGLIKIVILAESFEEAVRILCDKLRIELPPKEMSDEALPEALRRMREVPIEKGVLLYAKEILD